MDDLEVQYVREQTLGHEQSKVLTFVQELESLPVHGTLIRVRVRLGATETISYIGFRLLDPPGSALPSDDYSEAQANAAATGEYAQIDNFETATKVVFKDASGDFHRAWRFRGWGEGISFLFLVDTHTNEVIAAYSEDLGLDVSGSITGTGTENLAANDGNADQVTFVLPSLGVAALADDTPCPPETSETPEDSGFTCTVADEPGCSAGDYAFTGLPSDARIEAGFAGEWVSVFDCSELGSGGEASFHICREHAYEGELFPPASCKVAGGTTDFAFPESGPADEFEVAVVNAFLEATQTHDWFAELMPGTGIDDGVHCSVNATSGLVAGFNPVYGIHALRADSFSYNWAFSTVISHEYGHFILFKLHPELVPTEENQTQLAFHEGFADTVATLSRDTPYIGLGFRQGSPDEFVRRVDEPNVGVDPLPSWCFSPFGQATHCAGLRLAGAFWDYRELAGDAAAERLFADFAVITTGHLDSAVLSEVLAADEDDDGDFTNGTENSEDILAAFNAHGWFSTPGTVNVAWEGPVLNPEPVEDEDYTVDYRFIPPRVTLITTEKIENSVPQAVDRWIIGALDDSTNPPTPLDIGRIDADWEGDPHNVTIEVGDVDDEDFRCANVHIVTPDAQSGSNWTEVRFALTGSLVGIARAFPTSTSGGRVSGTIEGSAARIEAYAVGTGADQAGVLSVGEELSELQIAELPGASQLFAKSIGQVLVDADIAGDVTLRGDSAGSLLANADASGSGDVDGDLTINRGNFNGNICGDNLESWEPTDPIPSNLNIVWGPDGTICGNVVCPEGSAPDSPEEEPSGTNKNRYISFVVPDEVGDEIAIRVRLRSLNNGDPDYAVFQGEVRYVNAIPEAQDDECDETAAGAGPKFKCAQLGCGPEYRDWEGIGEGDVWHVKGDAVTPDSIYDVEIIRKGDSDDALCPSVVTLEVRTGPWGDANCDGVANVNDISAVVNTLKGEGSPQLLHSQADLSPEFAPNEGLSVLSIASVVDALKSIPYSQNNPTPSGCE